LSQRLNHNDLFLGSVAVIHGSELCRQVMRQAVKKGGDRNSHLPPSFKGVGLADTFPGESKCPSFPGQIEKDDVEHFYSKTVKEVVDLMAPAAAVVAEVGEAAAREFKSLSVEETLSESRIHRTFLQSPIKNSQRYEVIPEEQTETQHQHEQLPLSSLPTTTTILPATVPTTTNATASIGTAEVTAKAAKTVYVDAEKVFFPSTRVGSKTCSKIKFKNRTSCAQRLVLEQPLQAPFVLSIQHRVVTVQPKSFLSVPVIYKPLVTGSHQADLVATRAGGERIRITLIGRAVVY